MPASIGSWLDQNPGALFAEPFREPVTVKKRELKRSALVRMRVFHDEDDYKTVETTEWRIRGFRPTVDLPFLFLLTHLEPLFPNLKAVDCFVVPLISKTELRLFYCYCSYRDTGWSKRQRDKDSQWATISALLCDEATIIAAANKIVDEFWNFVLTPLKSQFVDETSGKQKTNAVGSTESGAKAAVTQ